MAWLEIGEPDPPAPPEKDDPELDPCAVSSCLEVVEEVVVMIPAWMPSLQPESAPPPEPAVRQQGLMAWTDAADPQVDRGHWFGSGDGLSEQVRPVPAPAPPPQLAPGPTHGPSATRADALAGVPSEWDMAVVAGVGLGALLAVLVMRAFAGAWGVGLFSRLDGDDVLEHPTRKQIMGLLGRSPGLHFADLARQARLSHGVLTHHLRKLVHGGQITEAIGKGYTCYFLAGSLDRRVMLAVPLLKSDGARRVLRAIHESPGLSVTEVSARVEVSMASVHHHIKRLHEGGLVRKERDGRRVCHFPETLVQDTLAHLAGA